MNEEEQNEIVEDNTGGGEAVEGGFLRGIYIVSPCLVFFL